MDGRTGEPVAAGDLAERLDRADVVLFGELHGHPVGLPVAAAIWRDMLGHREEGRRPALLLEFFERDQQLAIDDYLAGMIEEDEFLGATGKRPDYDHREMLEFAKLRGHPVIAANAPRRYVRLARTDGFDRLRGLSPAQRSMFVLPPTDDGPKAYRDRFVEAMGGMDAGHGGSGPLDFLRAQLVWDATMADSVATALEHRHAPVALVVGRFHVEFDGATRSYLQARRRGADILSIVMVDAWSDELREEDRGRGDIVAYVGPVERASRPPAGSAESGSTDGDSGG
ncbi:MAG: ChaN family lipoprotein [Planctomycetota bacterium]